MKKNATELVFILDKSGSMGGLEGDVIGGYNAFLEKQKKTEGECFVTTVLFSDHTRLLHDRVPIGNVEALTEKDYVVGGCTALLDAIGVSVCRIRNAHDGMNDEEVPEHTVFVITTDGQENASNEYSLRNVNQLIEKMRNERGWEFLFIADDLNAVETAGKMGIARDRAVRYSARQGTSVMFCVLSESVADFRKCGKMNEDWAEGISAPKDRKRK